jgi:hypothetical protein
MPSSKTNSKQNYYILLPEELKLAIEGLGLTDTNRNTAIKLVYRILKQFHKKDIPFNNFISLSKSYFSKINSSYHKSFNPLLEANIVQVFKNKAGKESYIVGKTAKAYRINPKLITRNYIDTSFNSEKGSFDIMNSELKEETKKDLKRIKINAPKALALSRAYVDSLTEESFKVVDVSEIISSTISVKFSVNPSSFTLRPEQALAKAEEENKVLFRNKNKFIIDNPETYINRKKFKVSYSDEIAIRNFEKGIFSISQSETNNRIDTPLTNFPNRLIETLSVDGEKLVSNDCANSQLMLLGYIMYGILNGETNTGIQSILNGYDFEEATEYLNRKEYLYNAYEFIKCSQQGMIYPYLTKKLSLKDINTSKLFSFAVLFSSHKKGSNEKNMFNSVFPVAGEFARLFKKNNNDELAVMLQKVESYIFTNLIYSKCKAEGILVFTKHDEILSKESDSLRVKGIMLDVFENVLGTPVTIKTDKKKEDTELDVNVVKNVNKQLVMNVEEKEYTYTTKPDITQNSLDIEVKTIAEIDEEFFAKLSEVIAEFEKEETTIFNLMSK